MTDIPSPQPDDGGPAFPRMFKYPNGHTAPEADGMSLRDYFAAKALTQSCQDNSPATAAALAYEYADAMLKARQA